MQFRGHGNAARVTSLCRLFSHSLLCLHPMLLTAYLCLDVCVLCVLCGLVESSPDVLMNIWTAPGVSHDGTWHRWASSLATAAPCWYSGRSLYSSVSQMVARDPRKTASRRFGVSSFRTSLSESARLATFDV